MRSRKLPATLFLAVLVLLAGALVGCGGGGDQAGDGSQDGASGEAGEQGGKAAGKERERPEIKIALGTVASVNTEARRLVLRPSSEVQGGERIFFKVRRDRAKLTLDGEAVELADVKSGQQAQVEYVARKKRNLVRAVELFSSGEGEDGGEEGQSEGGAESTG